MIRGRNIWSAGHSVSGVTEVLAVADLVARTRAEYDEARSASKIVLDFDGSGHS